MKKTWIISGVAICLVAGCQSVYHGLDSTAAKQSNHMLLSANGDSRLLSLNESAPPQAGLKAVALSPSRHFAVLAPSVSKSSVEAGIRHKLTASRLDRVEVSLQRVDTLDPAQKADINDLTLDSTVWVVTATGDVTSPFGKRSKQEKDGSVTQTDTHDSKAIFVVSAEDGRILSGLTYK